MSTQSSEEARSAWADAVAESNNAADLMQASIEAGDSEMVINARSTELEISNRLVEEKYKAYLKTMENWVTEAPRRFNALIVPSVLRTESGKSVPALTFAFRGGTEAPVTVTMASVESDMRAFQKDLDRAITSAIRESRKAHE